MAIGPMAILYFDHHVKSPCFFQHRKERMKIVSIMLYKNSVYFMINVLKYYCVKSFFPEGFNYFIVLSQQDR
ncbi:hypothetical protein BLOT_007968 [Blomia tropicalis]|nr:hypothetical protein BLOT_007968 [Blomia tropicalis]